MTNDQLIENNDDMPTEVDFSKGVRGKFYRPGMRISIPVHVHFTEEMMKFLFTKAESDGVSLDDLITCLLEKQVALMRGGNSE